MMTVEAIGRLIVLQVGCFKILAYDFHGIHSKDYQDARVGHHKKHFEKMDKEYNVMPILFSHKFAQGSLEGLVAKYFEEVHVEVYTPEYPFDELLITLSNDDKLLLIFTYDDDKVKQVDDYYLFGDAFMEIDEKKNRENYADQPNHMK